MTDLDAGIETIGGDGGGGDATPPPPVSDPVRYGEPEPQQPERPQPQRGNNGQFAPKPRAPLSWKADIAERHWSQLHPEIQDYISQRELESHRAITNYGGRLKNYEPWDALTKEYGDYLSSIGVADPVQGLRGLVQSEQMIRQNPRLETFAHVAQQYGVDLLGEMRTQFEPELRQAMEAAQQWQNYAEGIGSQISALTQERDAIKQEFAEYKRETEAKAKAAEARNAARVNVRSSSGYSSPKTIDETLDALARKHYG